MRPLLTLCNYEATEADVATAVDSLFATDDNDDYRSLPGEGGPRQPLYAAL